MSDLLEREPQISHDITLKVLDTILHDFGLARSNRKSKQTYQHVPIGAVPSLANAIAATQIFEARGGEPQTINIDLQRSHNYLDPDIGMTPTINGQEITLDLVAGSPFLSRIYETTDGRHVVPSAVYVDLVYQWSTFLRCAVNHDDVAAAIKRWTAHDLEQAAGFAGLPLAIVQSVESWEATEQGELLASLPIVPVKKAMIESIMCHACHCWPEYGASVLQIMYTHGFEHPFVYTYANLGCASSRLGLNKEGHRVHMWKLVQDTDVWIDSYRDGAMRKFGFTDDKLHEANPCLIISHVRVYGTEGRWASKPGFDMQGSASSGMMALCGGGLSTPAFPPRMVINDNDYTTGYHGAIAIQATILRRMKEGGGYILSPSLTGTAMSIVKHFKASVFPELERNKTGQTAFP